MALEQKNEKSLQNRINNYLGRRPVIYAAVESGEEMIGAIIDELNKAEEDLKVVTERIHRLQWALAKAES